MSFLYGAYIQYFAKIPTPMRSFADQTVIITGGNSGLGREAARHIVRLGAAKVILACRSLESGRLAKDDIESTTGHKGIIEVWHLDMAVFKSVRDFAERASKLHRIDAALLNAGVATGHWRLAEGHDDQTTINVLSTIYLAILLLPAMEHTATRVNVVPRLCVVTSGLHAFARFPQRNATNIFDTLKDKKDFDKTWTDRYGASKMIQVLLLEALLSRRKNASSKRQAQVIIDYLDPGLNKTRLNRDTGGPIRAILELLKFAMGWKPEKGSRTQVLAVEDRSSSSPAADERHGKYLDGLGAKESGLSPLVRSQEGKKLQEKLWKEYMEIMESAHPGLAQLI